MANPSRPTVRRFADGDLVRDNAPDAERLAAAVAEALTVPEPEPATSVEAWETYKRDGDFRRAYVASTLQRYPLYGLDSTLAVLATLPQQTREATS